MTKDQELQLMMDPELREQMMTSFGTGEESAPELQDPSKDFAANAQADYMKMNQEQLASTAGQGQGLSAAADATTAAGAASANPFIAGAGLAMKGIGMVDSAKRQGEQAKIDAYNRKVMAERSAIRNFFA
jgi:hypothetical protein